MSPLLQPNHVRNFLPLYTDGGEGYYEEFELDDFTTPGQLHALKQSTWEIAKLKFGLPRCLQ
ncbi:hypothetical protein Trydic_g14259, partial [Trypoxylus dichotomus]